VRRCRSATAGNTLSDFIKPPVKRVKSDMQAFVVKVEYAADHHEAEKPVVMVQVTNHPVDRAADEDNEFPQGTHFNRLRVAIER
jgi:hypothetical protein